MFLISAGMLIITGILFVLFSDSTEQHWNKLADEDDDDDDGNNELGLRYSKVPLNELPNNENLTESRRES